MSLDRMPINYVCLDSTITRMTKLDKPLQTCLTSLSEAPPNCLDPPADSQEALVSFSSHFPMSLCRHTKDVAKSISTARVGVMMKFLS